MVGTIAAQPRQIQKLRSGDGFTLIELLVVILIIGILASIAVPSFLAQRSKGQDACAKSMARAMQTAMETYATDNDGKYTGADVSQLNKIESAITDSKCGSASNLAIGQAASAGACDASAPGSNDYCVQAVAATGNSFAVARAANGKITHICTRADTHGGCIGAGAGGTW